MNTKRIGRRAFLRGALAGAGVTLALPALEATTGTAPVRLLSVFFKNGVLMEKWTPAQAGADFTLPACLSPLNDHRSQLNVITGLFNPGAVSGPGDDHIRGTGSFATGTGITTTGAGGPSFDQIAARELGSATKLSSLAIAPEGYPGGGENGGVADAINHLSWSSKNTPVPPQVDPLALFNKLFDGGLDAQALDGLRARRKSVLDSVAADAQRLQLRLGASDRRRLDAHLTAVRELERTSVASAMCMMPEAPEAWPRTAGVAPEAKIKVMIDLMVRAMACDLTRFGSFSLLLDVSPRLKEKFGEQRDHHTISHDASAAAKPVIEEYSRYQVELFAYLLTRMKEVDEGEGTLLDNSAVFFANQVAHGDLHTHDNLPVIVAGSAAGQFVTGRHLHLYEGEPKPGRRDTTAKNGRTINDLFLTLLGAAGVSGVTTFGSDGTQPLALG